jgi:hypothetical protein
MKFKGENIASLVIHIILGMGIIFKTLYINDALAQTSARAHGMGGTGHAIMDINDSLFLNPAVSALIPAYSLNGSYYSEGGNSEYTLSAVDGTSKLFTAGLGYTKKKENAQWNGAISHRLSNIAAIGAKVTHLTAVPGTANLTYMGAGLFVRLPIKSALFQEFNLGSTFEGLVGDKDRVDKVGNIAMAMRFIKILLLTAEAGFPLETQLSGTSSRFGGELGLGTFLIRAGYRNEKHLGFKAPTMGVAWQAEKIRFGWAHEKRERTGPGGGEYDFNIFTLTIFIK